MGFRVYCDGYLLHDSNLNNFKLSAPKLVHEVNKAGEFTFSIPFTHVYYDKLILKKSTIEIYENGTWLWSGRISKITTKMNLLKMVTCEGELAYLHDSNQRLAEYHEISVTDYFTELIEKHNASVADNRKFTVGNVTVEDNNDSLYRYSNYEDTFDTIKSKLIDRLGGYVVTRHSGGTVYIDYVKTYPYSTNQPIRFGSNIIDISLEDVGSDTISGIIPLGCKLSEDDTTETASDNSGTGNDQEKRLTIESVNDGVDYIYDEDAVERLGGLILDVIKFDDVTIPENLLQKGHDELSKRLYSKITISLSVFDKSYVEENLSRLHLGATVVVDSQKHGLRNESMMISKVSMRLDDITQTKITIGTTKSSLAGNVVENNNNFDTKVENIVKDYVANEEKTVINPKVEELRSLIEQTADNIRMEVSGTYVTQDGLEKTLEGYTTSIEETEKMVEIRFVESKEYTDGEVTKYREETEKYIRFEDGVIILGEVNSPFQARLSSVKLAFLQNGNEVAYISNDTLYITQAHVITKLAIGDTTSGYYDWVIRKNGSISLKYRRGGDE